MHFDDEGTITVWVNFPCHGVQGSTARESLSGSAALKGGASGPTGAWPNGEYASASSPTFGVLCNKLPKRKSFRQ
jgi:hypothetical protein